MLTSYDNTKLLDRMIHAELTSPFSKCLLELTRNGTFEYKSRQNSPLDISSTQSEQVCKSNQSETNSSKTKSIIQSKVLSEKKGDKKSKMSIIPILFRDSFMDNFLDDFFEPPRERFFARAYPNDLLMAINNLPVRRGFQGSHPYNQIRRDNQSKDGSFQVSVDVQHFKPEEISVKMSDNFVTVEGKHEEKEDEHGYVFRHFVRKYQIPEGHDLEKLVSSLSSDGVLTIKAPKLALPAAEKEKTIPIVQTGKPVKQVENEKDKENQKDSK